MKALEAQKRVVKTSIENCSMSRDWMLSSLASKALFSLLNAKCSCCQKIFLRCLKPNSVGFLNVPYIKTRSSLVGGDLIRWFM